MTELTERQHTGEFLLWESSPGRSRKSVTVTVAAGTILQAGHVLGKLSATGKYVEYDNAGSDGSEAAAGILYREIDNSDGESATDFTELVVIREATVDKGSLKWNSGVDDTGKTAAYADLEAINGPIVARD